MNKVKTIWTKDRIIPLFISLICLGCSSIITIMLCRDFGQSELSKNIFTMLAIGIESAKYFFFFKGCLGDKDLGNGLRRIYIAIGVGCFIISIVATLSFGYNEAVTVDNNVSGNNQIAELQKNDIAVKSNQINNLQSQIKTLEAEKITEINKWDKYKHSSKRDALATTYNTKIEKLNSQIDNLNATTVNLTEVKTTKKENSGLATFFAGITLIGTPFERVFLIFFAILTELIGIFANIEYSRKSRKILKQYTVYEDADNITPASDEAQKLSDSFPPTLSKNNNDSQNLVTANQKRKIGFDTDDIICNQCHVLTDANNNSNNKSQSNKQSFNIHEAVRVYASTVLSNPKKDNTCIGLDAIVKITNYNRNELRKAKNFLEHDGALQVIGLTTHIKNIDRLKSYT